MQFIQRFPRRSDRGYVLLITLVFLTISLLVLGSLLQLTYTEAGLTGRNNLYNSSVSAAEAATEMVIARMNRDFVYQSVNPDLDIYRSLTPAAAQGDWPIEFQFSDGAGVADATGVISLGPAVITNLNSQFAGLYGKLMPFRVTSTARPQSQLYDLSATVIQDIQLASIPIFQYAVFYNLDLEINPGPLMLINGKVHSNRDIYTAPQTGLQFKDVVTAAGKISNNRHPNDPTGGPKVPPVYSKDHIEKVSSLNLPIGADNDPANVQQILDPPPWYEDPNSPLARQRYYNKTDLIITTTHTGVRVSGGRWNGFTAIAPDLTNGTYSFVRTNTSFFDLRENRWTVTTELDVAAFNSWMQDPANGGLVNAQAGGSIGHELNSVYVDDQRNQPGRLTVVRVVNGQKLPSAGLTVCTPLPLYVKGNFNLNNGDTTPGQADTSKTKPSSLVGDAITILSQNWDDGNAGKALNKRGAANTTVNAAFLAGIVQTTKSGGNKYYSGGVENFPRFLEDWDGKTLTYNGSMVVLFASRFGTRYWSAPGNYYNPPTRKWAFDVSFLDYSKLPPCTPQLRKLVRGQWNVSALP